MLDGIQMPRAGGRGTEGPKDPAQDRARLEKAAAEFEAVLLAEMLKSMRADRGWLGTGEDQAGASMLEIGEEHLAQVLASSGGLGLARIITQDLAKPKFHL